MQWLPDTDSEGMINAFLRRMYKYHFVSECFDLDAIYDDMDRKCFKLICSPIHCLHPLLPYVRTQEQHIRASLQRL